MSVTPYRLLGLATAAAAVVLFTAGPAAAAPAPVTTTDPAAAAAGWLAQQFTGKAADHLELSYGGQSFPDYGGTADAIFALAATKSGKSTIDAALGYLQKHVADYADPAGKNGGPYDGSLAKLALAAEVAGADPTDFGGYNLVQLLQQDECPASGKKNCALGTPSNIFSSVSESLIILAEARAGTRYVPSDAAVHYFLSLQCPGGGFTEKPTACTSSKDGSVDETGYGVAALLALGGHPAQVQDAVGWLKQQRHRGGYWVAQGGPDVDSTGLAASALDAAGVDTASSRHWLASQQVTAGPTLGTGAARGALKFQGTFDASSSVKATADGLLGMVPDSSLATLSAAGASEGTAVLALAPARAGHSSVPQGGTQTVTGTGFSAAEQVSAVLHSQPVPVGHGTAGRNGSVSLTFTVPASLDPGRHTLTLTGASSGLTTAATFTVAAAHVVTAAPTPPGASTPPTAPVLANTGTPGAQVLAEALAGLGLLLAGTAIAYAGRRRHP